MSYPSSNTLPSPSPVRRTNLTALILEQLRQYVLTHGLTANDRLPPERHLAVHLRVSRPSLRNALDWLNERGAVRRVQGGGTFLESNFLDALTEPLEAAQQRTPRSAEVVEARLILEPALARLAAARISTIELETLSAELARMEKQLDSFAAWRQHDLKFHLLIARSAGNCVLCTTFESLAAHIVALWTANSDRWDGVQSMADHRAIFEALSRHDGETAARRMQRHVEGFGHALAAELVKMGA